MRSEALATGVRPAICTDWRAAVCTGWRPMKIRSGHPVRTLFRTELSPQTGHRGQALSAGEKIPAGLER